MKYAELIQEEESYLRWQERHAQKGIVRDRIRFLRLLKSGQCKSQWAAGEAIGLQGRQSQRLWQQYRQQGYAGLVQAYSNHNFGKLSSAQISRLQAYLRQDQVSQLAEAQAYIATEFGTHYTISGICKLFQRLQIKLKTGRPVNIRQDEAQAEAFKKTFRL
ncbi:MAG: winged helix-turn-helix domain-containing protein [Bacteroidota bacterium]|nr:winged helix-turn-helix domain-containing protein [Bacteroidota bacterium]